MSRFDETKPYSCTYGMGGIQGYEQNGLKYNARKKLIEDPAAIATAAADAEATQVADAKADAAGTDPAPVDTPDYAGMHWATLKKLVEEQGGEWIDKPAAIAFLSGN